MLTYLGVLLGAIVGLTLGTKELFRSELGYELDTPAWFWGIWISGVVFALIIAFLKKRRWWGFWVPLVVSIVGGMMYPVAVFFTIFMVGTLLFAAQEAGRSPLRAVIIVLILAAFLIIGLFGGEDVEE